MKFDGFKRSVRANRHDRSTGDAPNIGRVSRMPGTGIPKKKARRRSQHRERGLQSAGEGSKRSAVLTVLLIAGVVVSLGVAVWLWVSPQIATEKALGLLAPVENEARVRVSAKFSPPSEKDAMALVKRAVAIRDPGAVAGLFRTGDSSPADIAGFLDGMEERDGRLIDYEWLGTVEVDRLQVEGVVVVLENENGRRNRLALLTPDTGGVWKVDFDAFARTVRPSWKEIVESRTETALVRVQMAKDNYFNGPFRDEKQWMCIGMASPDTQEMLVGYCRFGSPQASAVERIFSKENVQMCRATLELRRVEGAERRQFEISRVLALDWIVDLVAYDENFR